MAGQSSVDRQAMATAATQVDSAVQTIRGLQSSMNSYAQNLQGAWKGQAASAFNSTYEAFSADFSKVIQSLDSIHEKLVGTQSQYSSTEESNVSSMKSVNSLLGD